MQIPNSHPTSTRNPDPLYVRASVASICNLACVYCPKKEGMENRVPITLVGHNLSVEHYCENLSHLARNGIGAVSFTGGEPTLNPKLPELVAFSRNIFPCVELTTNGFKLPELLPSLAPNLDLLKVSLDATDPEMVQAISRGSRHEANRAVHAIRSGVAVGLRVGVNMVLMRWNMSQIQPIIDLCREVSSAGPGSAYLSILDFYYSDERSQFWQQEFVPLNILEETFTRLYGPPRRQDKFGCRFLWFNADGVEVRFKDSYGATMRAPKCQRCSEYCQEGVYGLKHSIEGWVTTCPTNDSDHGVHLFPGIGSEEADRRLAGLISDIRNAQPEPNSFQTLVSRHALTLRHFGDNKSKLQSGPPPKSKELKIEG